MRGEIRALRDTVLDGLSTRPGTTNAERARQGAWDTILKPRHGEARRKLEDFMKPKRWIIGEGESDPGIALVPSHFDHVIRQVVTQVYTRLGGALRQYHSVRVVWRPKLRFGVKKGYNAPIGSKSAITRQRKDAERERKEKKEAMTLHYERTLDTILEEFAEKRTLLRGVLDGLQSAMDGLMRTEEKRLQALAKAAPDEVRAATQPLLKALKDKRIEAKDYRTLSGEKSSVYGTRMRAWATLRTRTAKALA
ncbi:MAG: hypothetical protein P1V36_15970 [Planctomycetota bacterium]|nr:hypothetical protein [Planctomycetota bacterium]